MEALLLDLRASVPPFNPGPREARLPPSRKPLL